MLLPEHRRVQLDGIVQKMIRNGESEADIKIVVDDFKQKYESYDGKDGKDGLPGKDGVNGRDGKDGRDGVDGKDGAPGLNGLDGKDGLNGIDGKDGKDGVDGLPGQDGAPGKDGVNGHDGKDGVHGLDGIDGKDGKDGSPDTAEQILKKIKGKYSYKDLADKPEAFKGGGTGYLRELSDINLGNTEPTNNYVLGYDSSTKKWTPRVGSGSSQTLTQTLAQGNTTSGKNIILSAGDSIKSPSLTGTSLILDDTYISLTTDNGGYGSPYATLDTTKLELASLGNGGILMNLGSIAIAHNTLIQFSNAPVRFNNLTASTVPYLDASKNLVSSAVTPTQLGYLDATSSIQTQLNAKQPQINGTGFVKAVGTVISYDNTSYQPLDSDLTTIAGLTATTDNFIQSKAGSWSSRTVAQVKSDLGLTGTNSGDQTSIVGITGTKAQFDTAVTDGNFLYVGDITQYTDEMAQDAIGAMVDSTIVYTDGTPLLSRAALSGAITASAGSNTTALGSFTKSQLDTAVSDGNITYVGDAVTGLVGGNWKVFYTNGSGVITELALGASGTYLKSNGASSAPTFASPGFGYGTKAWRDTSTQSINASTTTKVQLNAEAWDLAAEYDPATNFRYTASTAGYYLVTFATKFTAAESGKRYAAFPILNGGNGIASSEIHASSTGELIVNGSGMVQLAANDYLELYVWHDSATAKNLNNGADCTYMTVQRMY